MAGWAYVGVSKLWGQTRMLGPCGRSYGIIREMFLDGCIDDTCLACLLRLFFPLLLYKFEWLRCDLVMNE